MNYSPYKKTLAKYSYKIARAKVKVSNFLTEYLKSNSVYQKLGELLLRKRRTFVFLASSFKAKNFFRKGKKGIKVKINKKFRRL